jgi:inner membrane protein
MEPLTHVLVGAALSNAGLRRSTALATPTLVIAANLPDIDGTCYALSPDLAFAWRHGWSHGLLAVALFPFVLAAAVLAFDARVRRRRHPDAAPANPRAILALAAAGVASHPALDWLNNYGVRLLMPFDGSWFYGDALSIVDPWLWLLLGLAVAWAWTRSPRASLGTVLLCAAMGTLVFTTDLLPPSIKVIWFCGLGALVALRAAIPARHEHRAARVALALSLFYICAMIAGSRIAEYHVRHLAAIRHWPATRVAAMPVPGQPARRHVIVEVPGEYLFVDVGWMAGVEPAVEPERRPRGAIDARVEAALRAPFVQGTRSWLRFPSYEVVPGPAGGHRVYIRDARFAVGNLPGYGIVATIDLTPELVPSQGPGR